MSELQRGRENYLAAYAAGGEAGQAPAWLTELRAQGIERFAERGLPSTRLEEWRYTNVASLARIPFQPAREASRLPSRSEIEAISAPVFACSLFVFVNGRFAPQLSVAEGDNAGARVVSLAHAPEHAEGRLGALVDTKLHPFAALNTAFLEDAALVTLPAGVEHVQPIHLVFVTTEAAEPTLTSPRVSIVAERGSRGFVIQDHVAVGGGPRFTTVVTEASVAQGASLDLVTLQRETDDTFHVANLTARVERDARFASHTVSLGGALVRNDLTALLADEGAECLLHGLFVGTGDQVLDNHTLVDHAMPHGTSHELYKGILGGRARGVFRGRVVVRPDAQKTDARQSNPNLLLSSGAEIDTKPQLEIHADDVKCSHGSSIGRLDPDALFYLRSRGISEARARQLLTQGFAAEVLDAIGQVPVADALRELLVTRLRAAGSLT